MTDVRQLLRAERASRRLTHPHASYTKDGKLLCNLCEIPVKSEAQWQSHLHSTQHVLRSQRARDAEDVRSAGTKKRKAESPTEDGEVEERKRVRASQDEVRESEQRSNLSRSPKTAVSEVHSAETKSASVPTQPQDDIDEAEIAAFERELASLEQESDQPQKILRSALTAGATISAAAMTAEEIAAQASQEKSAQRGQRDAEIEDEREDAARVLEDEFEEMQELEDRVKKLRDKREALRAGRDNEEAASEASKDHEVPSTNGDLPVSTGVEEEDDDDDDYDDQWGFGPS